jgi:putative ABC transport system permease protein
MKLMSLPLTYNVRNVFVRWRSTLATIFGVGMLVLVYVCLQSMAAGLEKSSRDTGDSRNVMILRKGSADESSSQITRDEFQRLKYLPGIAHGSQGQPLISADVLTVLSLARLDGSGNAVVSVRGMTPGGMLLRPQARLVRGRWFVPGHGEIVTSTRLAARFGHCDIGGTLRAGGRELRVVGLFDGGNTAFDSELWMDAEEARSVFELKNYSSVLARAGGSEGARALMDRIASDKAQPLRAETELHYYEQQTSGALPIKLLGEFLAAAMSAGALFAAMNTMYARVGARTREIGTLRALGYRRRTILGNLLLEGGMLAALGGVFGCVGALLVQAWLLARGTSFGTMNLSTFQEVMFQFRLTPVILLKGLGFAVAVGVAGSILPAFRAATLPVIAALKSF